MNATDRAKRSDSLHYDNIPRRALCDRIANLESDLEDTKAENLKLRELLRELYEIAQPEAPSMFEAEFADRLRELGVEVDRWICL